MDGAIFGAITFGDTEAAFYAERACCKPEAFRPQTLTESVTARELFASCGETAMYKRDGSSGVLHPRSSMILSLTDKDVEGPLS